jgi:hyperosmotically inducible periplasmic protein
MLRHFLIMLLLAGAASACAQAARVQSSGALDDASITARVKTVLLNDTQVAATRIDVVSSQGVVTLTGSVKSKADETRAIELARTVQGVRDVRSQLQVSSIPQS